MVLGKQTGIACKAVKEGNLHKKSTFAEDRRRGAV